MHEDDPWSRVTTRHGLAADEMVSVLQKEIRRGHCENAVLAAYEMASTSAELEDHLWTRLAIISVEDVGLGNAEAPALIDALARLRSRFHWSDGDRFTFAVHAIRVLATSLKDRSNDEMAGWVRHAVEVTGARPEIPDYALCFHTARGRSAGRDFAHWFVEGTPVEPEHDGRDTTYRERLLAINGLGGIAAPRPAPPPAP